MYLKVDSKIFRITVDVGIKIFQETLKYFGAWEKCPKISFGHRFYQSIKIVFLEEDDSMVDEGLPGDDGIHT
jgi:hypothetical protein